MRLFYSPAYTCAGHDFETTRKSGWIADSLAARPIAGVAIEAPAPLTEAEICTVHDAQYVTAVRTGNPRRLAMSSTFPWDPGMWPMVLASNGGALAAARAALADGVAGSLSSGLHHARRDRGDGFCTFNGLAIAAHLAGARSVLILDLDAHCGGGTHSLVVGVPGVRQVDVSVCDFDRYAPAAPNTLDLLTNPTEYLPVIERRLRALDAEGARFDLCLYNAGMDPFEDCSTGGLAGITREILAERERFVFDWCRRRGTPVAFVLAGGYVSTRLPQAGLVELHRLTIAAAAATSPGSAARSSSTART